MPLSITNIGTASVGAGSTFSLRAPPGGTPAGVIILGVVQDGSTVAGTLTDVSGNVYTNITAVHQGTLFAWYVGNALAISRGPAAGITYTQHTVNLGAQGSFVYITGTPTSHFLDTLVSASLSGGFTTQPSPLTSGAPISTGEMFIGGAAAVFTSPTTGAYIQDGANGWTAATGPNSSLLSPAGGTQTFSLGAGTFNNTGLGTKIYHPSFGNVPTTWATFIIAFTSIANQALSAQFNGAGSLRASFVPPARFALATFGGTGSLQATALQVFALYAEFDGSGAVNASAGLAQQNAAVFAGAGSLTANLTSLHQLQGSAVLAGTGSLAASTTLVDNSQFNGAGSVSAIATLNEVASATFSGAGSLSASMGLVKLGTIVFNGTGGLTPTVTSGVAALATFSGTGSLTAAFLPRAQITATFAGGGSLAATAAIAGFAFATFSGSGSMTTALRPVILSVPFNGSGSLSAYAALAQLNSATFSGAGSLTTVVGFLAVPALNGAGSLKANTTQISTLNIESAHLGAVGEFPLGQQQSLAILFAQQAAFNGTGGLTANAQQNSVVPATIAMLDGDGGMCASAEVLIGTPGQTTNDECPGPGPTENVVT